MDKRYKKLTKNTIIYSLGVFGSKFVAFFLVPLYTNVLSKSNYGVADLITTISGLLLPLFSLSLGESILFYGVRSDSQEQRDKYYKTGFLLILTSCLALIIFSPLFLFYGSIKDYIFFLTGYAVLEIIRNYLRCYTKAQDKNLFYSIDCIIYVVVIASLSILLLLVFHFGIYGYLWAYIIAEFMSIVFLLIVNKGFKKFFYVKFDKQVAIEMVRYSLPLILNSISWTIANSSDKVMLELLIDGEEGLESVGLYTAASKIPTMLSTIAGLFCQAWTISTYLEIGNKDSVFYSKVFYYFSFAMLICCSGMLLITRPFMRIYVGSEFQPIPPSQDSPGSPGAVVFVPFLIVATIFQSYATYFGSIIQSGGKNLFMMISTLTAAIVNLILNYFLIVFYGIQGACISTAVSFLIVFAMRYFFSKKVFCFPTKPLKLVFLLIIVIGQAISVVYEFHYFLIGCLALWLILILNTDTIVDLLKFISGSFKRIRKV